MNEGLGELRVPQALFYAEFYANKKIIFVIQRFGPKT